MGFSRLGQVNAYCLLTQQGTVPEGRNGTVRNRKFTIVRDPQVAFHVPSAPPPRPPLMASLQPSSVAPIIQVQFSHC